MSARHALFKMHRSSSFWNLPERASNPDRTWLWIPGHEQDSVDYLAVGTRAARNPRGYAKDGVDEDGLFDPDLAGEVGWLTDRSRNG